MKKDFNFAVVMTAAFSGGVVSYHNTLENARKACVKVQNNEGRGACGIACMSEHAAMMYREAFLERGIDNPVISMYCDLKPYVPFRKERGYEDTMCLEENKRYTLEYELMLRQETQMKLTQELAIIKMDIERIQKELDEEEHA